jgi:protein-tyrosine phosphatase
MKIANCWKSAVSLLLAAWLPATGLALPEDPSAMVVAERLIQYDAQSPITLRWKQDLGTDSMDIYAGTSPNQAIGNMVVVARDIPAHQGALAIDAFDNVRPYFALTPAGEQEIIGRVAVRLLPLEGGRNFRDLGGYPAANGKRVKWGMLYRSGVMHALTDSDYGFLGHLDIRVVCDYRAVEERAEEPTHWQAGNIEYLSWNYSSQDDSQALADLFRSGNITAEASHQAMEDLYPEMIETHSERFKAMFDNLLAGKAPLVFNCSAGKDRTGISAALLLSALGVPRELVVHDYALSDDYVDYMAEFADQMNNPDGPYAFLAQLPIEALQPLMASHPDYIEGVLDHLESEYGSVLNFLKTEFGLSDSDIEKLREMYLM